MPAKRITDEQVFQVVSDYIEAEGFSPSVRDVARQVGCSISTAARYLVGLEHDGRLVSSPGIPRSIRVVKS